MDTRARRFGGGGPERLRNAREPVPASRGSSSRAGVKVEEPLKAIGYMTVLLLAFVALFLYVVSELPGVSAAGWRAQVSPYHPANGPTVSANVRYERLAGRASDELKHLMGTESRAYAQP